MLHILTSSRVIQPKTVLFCCTSDRTDAKTVRNQCTTGRQRRGRRSLRVKTERTSTLNSVHRHGMPLEGTLVGSPETRLDSSGCGDMARDRFANMPTIFAGRVVIHDEPRPSRPTNINNATDPTDGDLFWSRPRPTRTRGIHRNAELFERWWPFVVPAQPGRCDATTQHSRL